MSTLLGRYSHCNQGYYNINKLRRIKLLLIKNYYSQLVACWICIRQISKMRKIHSGGLKMKYNSLIRKGRNDCKISSFMFFSFKCLTGKKISLRNCLNQFFTHWSCWLCLWMMSGSYVLGVSLPNNCLCCFFSFLFPIRHNVLFIADKEGTLFLDQKSLICREEAFYF